MQLSWSPFPTLLWIIVAFCPAVHCPHSSSFVQSFHQPYYVITATKFTSPRYFIPCVCLCVVCHCLNFSSQSVSLHALIVGFGCGFYFCIACLSSFSFHPSFHQPLINDHIASSNFNHLASLVWFCVFPPLPHHPFLGGLGCQFYSALCPLTRIVSFFLCLNFN